VSDNFLTAKQTVLKCTKGPCNHAIKLYNAVQNTNAETKQQTACGRKLK